MQPLTYKSFLASLLWLMSRFVGQNDSSVAMRSQGFVGALDP